eukprot:TRINITY_DN4612_c0_g1_i1.p1 TRINITY_DN4612_c0_g1~~TRINITY_DN4612_c0_g1_i1.p1  ORF type:complete len:927 (+),score=311.17 TRINITY_DN4612_c0_g1_i1:94-2781(+)
MDPRRGSLSLTSSPETPGFPTLSMFRLAKEKNRMRPLSAEVPAVLPEPSAGEELLIDKPADAAGMEYADVFNAWQVEGTQSVAATELIFAMLTRGGRFTCAAARREYAVVIGSLRILGRVDRLDQGGTVHFLSRVFDVVGNDALHNNRANNLDWQEPAEMTRDAHLSYLIHAGQARQNVWEAAYAFDIDGWTAYCKALKASLSRHCDEHHAGMVDLAELQKALQHTSFGSISLSLHLTNPLAHVEFSGDPMPCPVEVCGVVVPTTVEYWRSHVPTGIAVHILNAVTGAADARGLLRAESTDAAAGGGGDPSQVLPEAMQHHVRQTFSAFARTELAAALAEVRAAAGAAKAEVVPWRPALCNTFRSAKSHPLLKSHLQCLRCTRFVLAIDQHGAPVGAYSTGRGSGGAASDSLGGSVGSMPSSFPSCASAEGSDAVSEGEQERADRLAARGYCVGCGAAHEDWQRVPAAAVAGQVQARYNRDFERGGSVRRVRGKQRDEWDICATELMNARSIDYTAFIEAYEAEEERLAREAAHKQMYGTPGMSPSQQPAAPPAAADKEEEEGPAMEPALPAAAASSGSSPVGSPLLAAQRGGSSRGTPSAPGSPSSQGLTPSPCDKAFEMVAVAPDKDEKPFNPFSRKARLRAEGGGGSPKQTPHARPLRPTRPATAGAAPVRKQFYNNVACPNCGRGMLAIDQFGAPLLQDVDPVSGRSVPIECPGCGVTSVDWPKRSFVDQQLKFERVANREAQRRFHEPLEGHLARERARADLVVQKREEKETQAKDRIREAKQQARLQYRLAHGPPEGFATDADGGLVVTHPFLECLRCGRPQLRVDQSGLEIGLSTCTSGAAQPLDCPGCHARHTDWKPRALPPQTLARGDRWWERNRRPAATARTSTA